MVDCIAKKKFWIKDQIHLGLHRFDVQSHLRKVARAGTLIGSFEVGRKKMAILFLWGVRLSAEGQGAAFHLSPLTWVQLCCFVLVGFLFGGFLVLLLVFGSLHLGFLHGFRLGPIGLLPVYRRRLYDRQSLERARRALKKNLRKVAR